MKKIGLIVYLVTISVVLNAQVYLGVNSKIALPTSSYQEVNNGFGVGFLIGYSSHDKFNFDLSMSNLWMNSLISNYQIGSLKANVKYNILQKSVKPYFGIGVGYFRKSFDGALNDNFYENGIGIIPSVGVLFDIKSIKGLVLRTEFCYTKVFTEHQISLFNFNIGLLYYFDNE